MEKYRTEILMAGPLLLLLAAFVIPGGNMDAEARIGIMKAFSGRWVLGHVLLLVALLAMVVWLADVYAAALEGLEWQAVAGALAVVLALFSQYGVAALQLYAFELMRSTPGAAQGLIESLDGSWFLLATLYLPAIGFLGGFSLLAWALRKAGRSKWQLVFLAAAGFFVTLGGVTQLQFLDCIGTLSLAAFSWLHVNTTE